jgi:release factor glutamine methyltransferase|tara:strand:- start:807 stop:1655 length:849 start_codon:yes stop_codon:yes gene_type:complete
MSNNILLRDYLKLQISKLADTNVEEGKIKSEALILHYLNISKAELYLDDIKVLDKDIKVMDNMFFELYQNKPIQHIIGESYFYENRFLTPPGVFIPRPESELLVDCAIDLISKRNKSLTIIDFCSGSGCILLSLAKKFPNHKYIGIDISDIAVQTARKNSELLDLKNVEFIKQDIFNYTSQKADLILCNPPYLAPNEIDHLEDSVKNHDPIAALTDYNDGTSFYKYLISNFDNLILKNGGMLLELPFSSVTKKIISYNDSFNNNKSVFYKDLEGKKRVIKIY